MIRATLLLLMLASVTLGQHVNSAPTPRALEHALTPIRPFAQEGVDWARAPTVSEPIRLYEGAPGEQWVTTGIVDLWYCGVDRDRAPYRYMAAMSGDHDPSASGPHLVFGHSLLVADSWVTLAECEEEWEGAGYTLPATLEPATVTGFPTDGSDDLGDFIGVRPSEGGGLTMYAHSQDLADVSGGDNSQHGWIATATFEEPLLFTYRNHIVAPDPILTQHNGSYGSFIRDGGVDYFHCLASGVNPLTGQLLKSHDGGETFARVAKLQCRWPALYGDLTKEMAPGWSLIRDPSGAEWGLTLLREIAGSGGEVLDSEVALFRVSSDRCRPVGDIYRAIPVGEEGSWTETEAGVGPIFVMPHPDSPHKIIVGTSGRSTDTVEGDTGSFGTAVIDWADRTEPAKALTPPSDRIATFLANRDNEGRLLPFGPRPATAEPWTSFGLANALPTGWASTLGTGSAISYQLSSSSSAPGMLMTAGSGGLFVRRDVTFNPATHAEVWIDADVGPASSAAVHLQFGFMNSTTSPTRGVIATLRPDDLDCGIGYYNGSGSYARIDIDQWAIFDDNKDHWLRRHSLSMGMVYVTPTNGATAGWIAVLMADGDQIVAAVDLTALSFGTDTALYPVIRLLRDGSGSDQSLLIDRARVRYGSKF